MSVRPPEWINESAPPPITRTFAKTSGDGFALWGMLCGSIGILLSPAAGGLLFGPAGLVFTAMAQARPLTNRARITAAAALSVVGLLLSAFVSVGGIDKVFSGGIYSWEGARAPEFTLKTVDGETVRLSDLHGKRVFIDVWATWCPPCRAMQPDLNRLAKEWAAKDVVVLGLSADSNPAVLEEYAKRSHFEYRIGWMDEDFPKPYATVPAYPTLLVVDRNGIIVAVEIGQHSYADLAALAGIPDYPGPPKDPPQS